MLGVSYGVGSALCYWIISEKGKVLSQITVQHLTSEEKICPDGQERIRDYHGSLEDAPRSEGFGTNLDGYDSFMNYDEEGIAKCETNEEGYQGPLDSPEIYEIIDNSDEDNAANSYAQYIGAEVLLPDRKGVKLMGKVSKRVRYDKTSTNKANYNFMHDKLLYESEYPDGTTEQLSDNIIAENILSQSISSTD